MYSSDLGFALAGFRGNSMHLAFFYMVAHDYSTYLLSHSKNMQ